MSYNKSWEAFKDMLLLCVNRLRLKENNITLQDLSCGNIFKQIICEVCKANVNPASNEDSVIKSFLEMEYPEIKLPTNGEKNDLLIGALLLDYWSLRLVESECEKRYQVYMFLGHDVKETIKRFLIKLLSRDTVQLTLEQLTTSIESLMPTTVDVLPATPASARSQGSLGMFLDSPVPKQQKLLAESQRKVRQLRSELDQEQLEKELLEEIKSLNVTIKELELSQQLLEDRNAKLEARCAKHEEALQLSRNIVNDQEILLAELSRAIQSKDKLLERLASENKELNQYVKGIQNDGNDSTEFEMSMSSFLQLPGSPLRVVDSDPLSVTVVNKLLVEKKAEVTEMGHLQRQTESRSVLRTQASTSTTFESADGGSRRQERSGLYDIPSASFAAEDKEAEVFNNTYLGDLKAGRVNLPSTSTDAERLDELQFRNSLRPPHLKSSYPAETQFHNPQSFRDEEVKGGKLLSPRAALREVNGGARPKIRKPNRIRQLFSTRPRRDKNSPMTLRGRRLSPFRKSARGREDC